MESVDECQLAKFFIRQQEHMLMFGWVQSIKKNMPSVTIRKAIEQFLEYYKLSGDVGSLEVRYQRMAEELRQAGL